MPARLNILGGRREGQSLELDDGTYQVGTGRAADIQLRDKGVGFKHAALRVDGSTVTVVDFKSRGGTFVNEERIPPNTEVRLTHGDSLRVGTTPLEVILAKEGPGVLDPPEASPTPLALSEELGLPAEAPGAEDETPGAEAEAEEGTARTPPEPAPPSGPAVADAEAQNPEQLDEAPETPPPGVDTPPQPRSDEEGAKARRAVEEGSAAPASRAPPADSGLEPALAASVEAALASGDPSLLAQTLQDLQRRLVSKTQEALALERALDAGAAASAPADAGGAVADYGVAVAEETESQVLALQQSLSEESARAFQLEEEVRALTARLGDAEQRHAAEIERLAKEKAAIEDNLEKAYTEIADLRRRLEESAGQTELEEANALLLDENEGLREEISALKVALEEERSKRGALVRERVASLRDETARMEHSNAEMRTLVEAYEEKIDELDERLEELEGENAALESLVGDLRAQLDKTEKERETMVRALRKKIKTLELRLEVGGVRADEQTQAV